MFIRDLIKKIVDSLDDEGKTEKQEMEECDTCGQISRLRCGLCDWCQKTYESNK
jgi:hypothetical protein